jgi:hypothetical protein
MVTKEPERLVERRLDPLNAGLQLCEPLLVRHPGRLAPSWLVLRARRRPPYKVARGCDSGNGVIGHLWVGCLHPEVHPIPIPDGPNRAEQGGRDEPSGADATRAELQLSDRTNPGGCPAWVLQGKPTGR